MRPVIVLFALLAIPAVGISDTLYVPDDHPAIQEAIDAALDGDVILVAPGSYEENINFSGKAIWVRSDGDGNPATHDISPEATTINGMRIDSVVKFINQEGPDSIIEGFRIKNGYSQEGGGIYCQDHSDPTIRNNIILKNGAENLGGGIACSHYCSARIENNRIYKNGTLNRGGGVACFWFCSVKMINNLIYDNSAAGNGGGIFLLDAYPLRGETENKIMNCTLYGNTADWGGGICCETAFPILTNTIVWNNMASHDPEISSLYLSYPEITYCDVKGGCPPYAMCENIIDADPLFIDPANHDFHLAETSPSINRGTNNEAPLEDFEGDPRPHMGTVDMGADEFTGMHLLSADVFSLSESTGGAVHFALEAGAHNGGRTYSILGSASGTNPGTPLGSGNVVLPIHFDFLTLFIWNRLNSSFFQNFLGTLNGTGSASATLSIPPVPGTAGLIMHYAYALQPFDFVSNPVVVEVVP